MHYEYIKSSKNQTNKPWWSQRNLPNKMTIMFESLIFSKQINLCFFFHLFFILWPNALNCYWKTNPFIKNEPVKSLKKTKKRYWWNKRNPVWIWYIFSKQIMHLYHLFLILSPIDLNLIQSFQNWKFKIIPKSKCLMNIPFSFLSTHKPLWETVPFLIQRHYSIKWLKRCVQSYFNKWWSKQ